MKTTRQEQAEELERIITGFQDELFRFAFFRVGSLADAQDIVQNVFIKMFGDHRDLSAVHNMKGYLFRCVSNGCMDFLRKKRPVRFVPLESVAYPADEEESTLMREYEKIERLMSDIPGEQAEIIRMKTIDNLSFVAIADILGIPVTTVKSRFKYGVDKLKTKFKHIVLFITLAISSF